MKKYLTAMVILSLLLFTACSTNPVSSTVTPAQLSGEEEAIVSLLGGDTHAYLFDYQLNFEPEAMLISVYQLEDGKWTEFQSSSYYEPGKKGRIAFRFDTIPEGFHEGVYTDGTKGNSSWVPLEEEPDLSNKAVGTGFLTNKHDIVQGEDVPLIHQVIMNENAESTSFFDLDESFNQPELYAGDEYDTVYMVTLRFEKK